MPEIQLITTHQTYSVSVEPGSSLLEALRVNNIPVQSVMVLNDADSFVSLTHVITEGDQLRAFSLRNTDFRCVEPQYMVVKNPDAVTEIVRPLQNPALLGLMQFSRLGAMDYVYASVKSTLDRYRELRPKRLPFQLALSPGGDGRVLVECIRRYWDEHPQEEFVAVIVAVGFEDESEHLSAGTALADRFKIPYQALGVREAADELGYKADLGDVSKSYRREHPLDEAEVMLTYWVQNINFRLAERAGRRAILFGYNQEDVIAERLYQAMTGQLLPAYPIRQLEKFDLLAPLSQVPKKLLDAMDVSNSLRNYRLRTASVSYLRSSLYLLAYYVAEQFPALADVLSGASLQAERPDDLLAWLEKQ